MGEERESYDGCADIDDVRDYIKQLLASAYSRRDVPEEKAVSLASLSAAIDRFLMNEQADRRAARAFKHELFEIVNNSEWGNAQKRKENGTRGSAESRYYTKDGGRIYLGNILGAGGEGVVYQISNMPEKAAKIYRPQSRSKYKERKIEAIINNKIPSKLDNVLINTLPEALVYNKNGEFEGFIMPRVTTSLKLFNVTRNSRDRSKYFPELDYRGLIIVGYNLAEAVSYMHDHDVVIGDMNPSNVAVNPDGTVCLIDADSFDITDKKTGEHFPCHVGLPEMLAPELQTAGNLRDVQFTNETDDFSLAIMIFRLLMDNVDPFYNGTTERMSQSISVKDTVEKAILDGMCPYIKNIAGVRLPDWAPPFELLPEYIQGLFVRAFDYDRYDFRDKIKDRPTANEWMAALMRFYSEDLRQCEINSFYWYRSELDHCPFCGREKPFQQSVNTDSVTLPSLPVNVITVGI